MGGEHNRHETATKTPRCKLEGNDGTQGITPANTHAQYKPSYSESIDNAHRITGTRKRLSECSRDDDHELYSIYSRMVRRGQNVLDVEEMIE